MTTEVLIIYGSETTICMYYASTLHRLFLTNHIHSHIINGNEATEEVLKSTKYLIVISSNTKEGQPPLNIEDFYYKIVKSTPNSLNLSHLKYTVIGVGNSTYEKHNKVGKVLDSKLSTLKAQRFYPSSFFDKKKYQDCCHGFLETCKQITIQLLKEGKSKKAFENDTYKKHFVGVNLTRNSSENNDADKYVDHLNGESTFELVQNKTITDPTHFQNVRVVKFKGDGNCLGDTVGLRVPNLENEILNLISLLGLSGGDLLEFSESSEGNPLHEDCRLCTLNEFYKKTNYIFYNFFLFDNRKISLYSFIKYFLDIRQTVSFITLKFLLNFNSNEQEKKELIKLSSPEGTSEFHAKIFSEKINIFEILKMFPSTKLPLEILLEFMPPLKLRQFSITNSTLDFNGSKDQIIETLVAVIEYQTPLSVRREGLFSDYIHFNESKKSIPQKFYGKIISTYLSSQEKRIKESSCIFIAAGTGISAVICFLRWKYEMVLKGKVEKMEDILIFGFRHSKKDYHYKEEIARMKERGLIIFEAISREGEKSYVQDKLIENKNLIWDRINNLKAMILLCGKAGLMPRGVRKALREIIMEEGNMDEHEMSKYYEALESEERVIEETWK